MDLDAEAEVTKFDAAQNAAVARMPREVPASKAVRSEASRTPKRPMPERRLNCKHHLNFPRI